MQSVSHADTGGRQNGNEGFSMLEMLVSIAILVLLMSAVFPFLFQAQRRFQGNVVTSEANQSVRAALEVMTQEVGQAGYNPQFLTAKSSTTSIVPNACPQFIHLTNADGITGLSPGDWVSVGTGANQELVQVLSTSGAATSAVCPTGCTCTPLTAPWIQAKFQSCHNNTTAPCNAATNPYTITSYKMPFGGGLLYTSGLTQSNDQTLEFFGDINQDGTIAYVVYALSPMSPAVSVTINGTSYTLYNLTRSYTSPVPFTSLPAPTSGYTKPTKSAASPMVEKVLYNTTLKQGPTGLPIFGYPNPIQIGQIPSITTVVGTIVITLSVAVNPQALETGQIQWSTMATQIRPLNLAAALNVSNSNGGLYLPLAPISLPMN